MSPSDALSPGDTLRPSDAIKRYDVAIIGSGFAGSILARVLRQQGKRVVLLEKGQHPRFALGESTTPLANFALERLARRSGLRDLFDLATYGRWQARLPHLRRGLKRGFTFYRHQRGEAFHNDATNRHRLLVAASPEDNLADTHWLRSDIDHHLVQQALAEGVDVRQCTSVLHVARHRGGWQLRASSQGHLTTFEASNVVDGSGPAAVVPRSLGLAPVDPETLPQATLLYTHAQCPQPLQQVAPSSNIWPTGPYPDAQAATHHLLDEGWIYLLPFDPPPNGAQAPHLASLGAVLYEDPSTHPTTVDEAPEGSWRRLLAPYPTLQTQLADLPIAGPWSRIAPLAYQQSQAAGEGWFLLPHTFAFCDPMFSTGMAWSLLAVERLSELLGAEQTTHGRVDSSAYADLLAKEADQITYLITAARAARHHFELFKHVAFLYFAMVSHAELRQRLLDPAPGPAPCWQGFLGASEESCQRLFRQAAQRIPQGMNDDMQATVTWLERAIRPWDAIGLDRPERNNLYPVDLEILLDRSEILGMDRRQMEEALPRLRGDDW